MPASPVYARARVPREALAAVVMTVALAWSAAAGAQQPAVAPGVPPVQMLATPWRLGDASDEAAQLPLDIAMLPMRLSLGGVASRGREYAGCVEAATANGSAPNGFLLQRSVAMRLVPRLALVGFSQTGCPMEASIGGGLVYTVPLRKDIWLVGSAGALVLPHAGPSGARVWRSEIAADVAVRTTPERTWTIGVGTRGLRIGGLL
jgi:hypothetical protein